MNTARSAVAVGIFVVVSLVLVVVGVAWTQRGIGSGDDTYRLYAMFDDVTGLAPGTKVTIAGYTVGRVEELKLEGTHVRVDLRLMKTVVAWTGLVDEKGLLKNAAVLQRLQASRVGAANHIRRPLLRRSPPAPGPSARKPTTPASLTPPDRHVKRSFVPEFA